MNEEDENGKKHGYWELEFSYSISKGNYIHGKKDGLWRMYWIDQLTHKVVYNSDNPVQSVLWRNYILKYNKLHISNSLKSDTIHQEEYE